MRASLGRTAICFRRRPHSIAAIVPDVQWDANELNAWGEGHASVLAPDG